MILTELAPFYLRQAFLHIVLNVLGKLSSRQETPSQTGFEAR